MASPPAPDIKALLTSHPISEVLTRRPLVFLPHTATVGDLLETLSLHGILSAPVFRARADTGAVQPSLGSLMGFADVWAVLVAFIQTLPAAAAPDGLSAEELEAHGAALCRRPVLSLFDSAPAIQAALAAGTEPHITCADWEMTDDATSSLLEVIRTCFLPRLPPPGSGASQLLSCGSGMGFMGGGGTPGAMASPRVSGGSAAGASPASPLVASGGHSRHPAASHRIVVSLPGTDNQLAVLSQSDILRFLAAHHESLRPLGKASLAELGLASGSLHLAAGPSTSTCSRPPALTSPSLSHHAQHHHAHTPSGGAPGGGVPSSPKPPLARGSLDLDRPPHLGGGSNHNASNSGGSGGGGVLLGSSPGAGGGMGAFGGGGAFGSSSILGSSPSGSESAGQAIGAALLQRGGSGGAAAAAGGGAPGTAGGPVMMQMSPPASPRVSTASSLLAGGRGGSSSLGGGVVGGSHRGHHHTTRRQLVAVHESVPVLEAFKVLLQQRVSAVAVLAGAGPSPNLRLVGNLSASDLRHLRAGGFGGLALTVKAFLASKPLAPDQAIRVSPPPATAAASLSPSAGGPAAAAAAAAAPKGAIIMAHAPTCFTCQATASLDELVRMLGGRCAGIHRVYVVDPDQRPAGVITTTDVLALLAAACA